MQNRPSFRARAARRVPRVRSFALAALWSCLGGLATAQVPDAVVNGSFEVQGPGGPSNIGLGIPPWVIGGGGIDIVLPQNGPCCFWVPADGQASLSLNWVSPSSIEQTLTTVPGAALEIRFWMAGEFRGGPPLRTMDVLWNHVVVGSPTFQYTGQGPTNMGWTEFVYPVVGTGTDILTFVSTTPNNHGPALDMVSVRPAVAGARAYGLTDGTGGCNGTHFLWVNGTPNVGNAGFALTCTHAPANANGFCLFGHSPTLGDPFGIGVQVLVQPTGNYSSSVRIITSDAAGQGTLPQAIPGNAALVGVRIDAQVFWSWTACAPSPLGISSSTGLELTLQ